MMPNLITRGVILSLACKVVGRCVVTAKREKKDLPRGNQYGILWSPGRGEKPPQFLILCFRKHIFTATLTKLLDNGHKNMSSIKIRLSTKSPPTNHLT